MEPRSGSSSPARSATNLSIVSGRGSPRLRWEIHSTNRLALRRCLPLARRSGQPVGGGRRAGPPRREAPLRRQRLFEPNILTNVEKGTPAFVEELFGPVAAVMTVPGEETAVAVANAPNTASAA